jgi:predicted HicB family RNase H-like nuclease
MSMKPSRKPVVKKNDRYLMIVEWSEEDRCYVGTCPELMIGGVHGASESRVLKELCQVVDEWIKIYEQDGGALPPATAGREYSGKFALRVGKELHKRIALEAMSAGRSLNSYCVDLLENLAHDRAKLVKKARGHSSLQ